MYMYMYGNVHDSYLFQQMYRPTLDHVNLQDLSLILFLTLILFTP